MQIDGLIFKCLQLWLFVTLSSCEPPEKFELYPVGSLKGDSLLSGSEFLIPKNNGDLVAISGRLVGEIADYREFLDDFRFDLRLEFENGRTKEFENLKPREASWHGVGRSFVVLSDIDEPREGRVTKVSINAKYDELGIGFGDEMLLLEFFAGVISK